MQWWREMLLASISASHSWWVLQTKGEAHFLGKVAMYSVHCSCTIEMPNLPRRVHWRHCVHWRRCAYSPHCFLRDLSCSGINTKCNGGGMCALAKRSHTCAAAPVALQPVFEDADAITVSFIVQCTLGGRITVQSQLVRCTSKMNS